MGLLESLKFLHGMRAKSNSVELVSDHSIVYKFVDRDSIKREFGDSELDFECLGENEISIEIFKIKGLYYDVEHFLKHCTGGVDIFNSDIGILNYKEGNYLFYNSNEKMSYIGNNSCESDRFIQNIIYYLELIKAFKSSEICTYHDDARREFVIISPEKGKLQIEYPLSPPDIPSELNLVNNYNLFCERNKSQEFELFLREQIIDSLSIIEKENRFPYLTYNIKQIIEASQRNYETYLNKFSFEELKKNFRRERDEYFISIRDILSKILEKVVTIPISISAAALAIYTVKSESHYVYVNIPFLVPLESGKIKHIGPHTDRVTTRSTLHAFG